MKIDLLAIDFDGTLLGPDGRVSPATKRAVRRAVDAGIVVVFATGRNWYEAQHVIEEVEHLGPAVFVGGAITVDTHGRKVLHRQAMDPQLAVEICRVFESHDLTPLVLQDREATGHDFVYGPLPVPAEVLDWHKRNDLRVVRAADLAEIDHGHTMRISTLGPNDAVDAAEGEIERLFAERVFHYRVDLANYGVRLLECFDPSVNKWAGVERVARDAGIDPAAVAAVGDDMNDLHMVERAGLGVAMGNARPELKAVADRVIGTNAEDGLAAFINEVVDARQ